MFMESDVFALYMKYEKVLKRGKTIIFRNTSQLSAITKLKNKYFTYYET